MPSLTAARADVTRVADRSPRRRARSPRSARARRCSPNSMRRKSNWRAAVLRQARGRGAGRRGDPAGRRGDHGRGWRRPSWGRHGIRPAVAALLVLTPVAVADALTPLAEAARALARARGERAAWRPSSTRTRPSRPRGIPRSTGRRPTTARHGHRPARRQRALVRPIARSRCAPSTWTCPLAPISRSAAPMAAGSRPCSPSSPATSTRRRGGMPWPVPTPSSNHSTARADGSPSSTTARTCSLPPCARTCDSRHGAVTTRSIEALHRAGLRPWLDGLADGLDTRLGTGGRGSRAASG